MHRVEEGHGARGQLAPRMWLDVPDQDGEMGNDAEDQERHQPDSVEPRLPTRVERDGQARDQPQVPGPIQGRLVAALGAGRARLVRPPWSHPIADAASPSMSSPQPG